MLAQEIFGRPTGVNSAAVIRASPRAKQAGRVLVTAFAGLLLSGALSGTLLVREDLATCTRVIDGDTIEVRIASKIEKVRLIGVDTPETVHPNKPVEFPLSAPITMMLRIGTGKVSWWDLLLAAFLLAAAVYSPCGSRARSCASAS